MKHQRKHIMALSVAIVSLVVVAAGPARTVTADGYLTGTPVPLNILWRVVNNSVVPTDRQVTINRTDTSTYPFEGALFYVPTSNIAGTQPLYGLCSPGGCADHMVSTITNEGSYSLDTTLGYPFASAASGLSQLFRPYNPTTGDHSLGNTSGVPDPETGYTVNEPVGIYGYTRYYNSEPMLSLSGGGVTITSNKAAGGALWHWTWNGKQIVNNDTFGRQIQSALFLYLNPPTNTLLVNPTEAGDIYTGNSTTDPHYPYVEPGIRHGSPVTVFQNNGMTQSTRAIPLDFDPDGTSGNEPNLGGSPNNPVIWKDMVIGKDITLNFNGLGPVAKYTTVITVPQPIPAYPTLALQAPIAALKASFREFHIYDAAANGGAGQDTDVSDAACSQPGGGRFSPAYGGMIAWDITNTVAYGIYGVNASQGGGFSVLNVGYSNGNGANCNAIDTGEFDNSTAILSFEYDGALATGTNTLNSYMISGNSVSAVEAKMHTLYQQGVR